MNQLMPLTNGVFYNLSSFDYHSNESHHSSSIIKKLLSKTGLAVQHDRMNKDGKSNPIYDFGSLVHALVLEPEKVPDQFLQMPFGLDARTKEGKATRDALNKRAQDAHITLIDAVSWERAICAAAAITSHPVASVLLRDTINEASLFVDVDGLPLKVRPDAISTCSPILLDIKTSADVSMANVMRSVCNYGYDISAAMYLDCINRCPELLKAANCPAFETMILIMVASEYPHEVTLFDLAEYLPVATAKYRHCLHLLRDCIGARWQNTFPTEVRMLPMPPWHEKVAPL